MSKRQADLFEKELAKAKKKRVELDEECSSLKTQLAASRKKVAALEAAKEEHDEEAVENRLSLVERSNDDAARRVGSQETEPPQSCIELVTGGPGKPALGEQQGLSNADEVSEAENCAPPRNDLGISKFSDGQEVINLSSRRADAMPDLSRFSKLDTLYMRSNLLIEISDRLPRTLVSLHLSDNKIEEIRGLDALVNLQDLFLSDNRLKKIQGLTNLVNLRLLTLDNNMISRIEGLDSLRVLRHLDLSHNKIRKIKNMAHLSNLESLIISSNPIENLENLDTLTHLTSLFVNDTEIESFNGIQKLVNLTTIHANGNAIANLDHLEPLGCLKSLWVKDNKISHWSNVEKLAKLPSLKSVALKGNPIETRDTADYRAAALLTLPLVESIDGVIDEHLYYATSS